MAVDEEVNAQRTSASGASNAPATRRDPRWVVLDTVPSMLAYWDRDLRCRFANRAYEAWFGVDPKGLEGRSLQDLLGPTLFALNEPYARAALAGRPQTFERDVPGPGGTTRRSLAHYMPDIVDGDTVGMVVQVTDVKPLHEARQALLEQVVERDSTLARLRNIEAALSQAQQLGRIGSWTWDIDTDRTAWSQQLHTMFGLDPTQPPPSYAEHARLYTPTSWSALQSAVAKALATGAPYALELQYVHQNGHTGWCEGLGSARRDEQGRIVALYGTVREITATVTLRAELQASAAQLQASFDAMAEGLVLHGRDGQIVEANPAAEYILGLTRDQLLGRSPMDPQWHAVRDDGTPFPGNGHPATVALRSGRPVREQIMGVPAPGRGTRWLSVNAVPVLDRGGAVDAATSAAPATGVVVTFADVTELHLARNRLRALVQDQHAMLDNDLVGIVRLRGQVAVWHNGALARMFGYEDGGLLGQTASLLYPDHDSCRAVEVAAREALRGGSNFRKQLEMLRKDGSRLWIDMSGHALALGSGESLWILNDISPMKRAESQRLETVRLAAENTQVRESNRLKSLFMANMSHELRTPLNAVLGLTELLQTGVVPQGSPRHQRYLEQIGTSGRHLLKLIDDVLTFSSTESGRLQFQPQPVQPDALAQEAVELLEADAAAKRIEIDWHMDPALPALHLDPLRLKQVMLNFLSNAVKFTPEGGRVSMRLLTEGPGHWRIEVEDTGIGIAPEDLDLMFTEFRQLSVGSSKRYQGAGMGLAVTRGLVEAQGGSVGVRSHLGSGSVFHAVLPRQMS